MTYDSATGKIWLWTTITKISTVKNEYNKDNTKYKPYAQKFWGCLARVCNLNTLPKRPLMRNCSGSTVWVVPLSEVPLES